MNKKAKLSAKLSVKRIADLRCPDDQDQVQLWDEDTPNLCVRLRPRGRPAFLFIASMASKQVNLVIGNCQTWKIPQAQEEARRLRTLIDQGIHPKLEREAKMEAAAKALADQAKTEITVGHVWTAYVARGIGKKGRPWSVKYKKGLDRAMSAGGEKYPRCGDRRTVSGPLFQLKDIAIGQLDDDALADAIEDELDRISDRAKEEAVDNPNPPGYATAKLAVEQLSGMYRWASKEREYRSLIKGNPARSPTVQDGLPGHGGIRRVDFVEVVQLKAFFEGLGELSNKTMAGYLTGLVLTGARRQELAKLKWSDIDFDLKKFTIADKTTTNTVRTREVPLASWLERVIKSMPRINDYVFAAPKSKLGYVQDARKALLPVMKKAKIVHLTPHGLRRTFSLVGESAACSSGAIEQIMGHSVTSMREHYKPRRVDQLREVLEQYEQYVIEQAGLPSHPGSSEDQQPAT